VTPRAAVALVAVAWFVVGCGADGGPDAGPTIVEVAAGDSIQSAVDRARPGDMVLIAGGIYNESVEVTTEDIVIRGEDRNAVILDGDMDLENGIVVRADGVAVENLTVRGYRANGVLFVGELDQRGASGDAYGAAAETVQLQGYRASYVTAHDNGLYGLYAFAAENGVFEHSYAAGHPDAGVYIGQCKPCDAVVRDVVAERNTIGYQAINASGVSIVSSTFTDNRMGIETGSQDVERLAPQVGHDIVGNRVSDNANELAPGTPDSAFGLGIVVSGGQQNVIERNVVSANPTAGIVVTDIDSYAPLGNVVRANLLVDNGVDVVYAVSDANRSTGDATNCFEANDSERPDALLDAGCLPLGEAADPLAAPAGPPTVTFAVQEVAVQPSRPGDTRGPWTSARGIDTAVDLAAVDRPKR
jgi:hypothetical protein